MKEIPLKLKYRVRKRAKKCKADYSGHANKARAKRPPTARERELHARQPKKRLHVLPNGKARMETIG